MMKSILIHISSSFYYNLFVFYFILVPTSISDSRYELGSPVLTARKSSLAKGIS